MCTEELRKMQRPIPGGRKWAMFMVAGGHFAGAIVRVSHPEEGTDEEVPSGQRKKPKKSKSELEVLLHKTFHRYTSMSVAITTSLSTVLNHSMQLGASRVVPSLRTTMPRVTQRVQVLCFGVMANKPFEKCVLYFHLPHEMLNLMEGYSWPPARLA